MKIIVFEDPHSFGEVAGNLFTSLIKQTIEEKEQVNIIVAAGSNPFETTTQLVKEGVFWSKILMFHLDKYIDLSMTMPVSFRKYLKRHFLNQVPCPKNCCIYLDRTSAALLPTVSESKDN